jgi:ClpP class serine protease
LSELTDGRIFDASQALDAGLVDKIGTLRDAIDIAEAGAGLKKARVVMYARPDEARENIYSLARAGGTQVNVLPVDRGVLAGSGPRFMYLWAPGLVD